MFSSVHLKIQHSIIHYKIFCINEHYSEFYTEIILYYNNMEISFHFHLSHESLTVYEISHYIKSLEY